MGEALPDIWTAHPSVARNQNPMRRVDDDEKAQRKRAGKEFVRCLFVGMA